MNNSVFGKSMENVRNRIDYSLMCDSKKAKKMFQNVRYKSHTIIRAQASEEDEGLVGFLCEPKQVMLNKPIYCGLTILDNSKLTMYQFHYEFIKPTYGSNAKLLFTDTDSLCYHIKTDDVYNDMKNNSQWFDTSNYEKDHTLYNTTHESLMGEVRDNKFQGYFKDETEGTPIVEFVGLRSKMYSILLPDNTSKMTAKGIKSCAQKRIKHEQYYNCIYSSDIKDQQQSISFHSFRSNRHELSTVKITKTSLSCYDDKKHITFNNNQWQSTSYGHYSLRQ